VTSLARWLGATLLCATFAGLGCRDRVLVGREPPLPTSGDLAGAGGSEGDDSGDDVSTRDAGADSALPGNGPRGNGSDAGDVGDGQGQNDDSQG